MPIVQLFGGLRQEEGQPVNITRCYLNKQQTRKYYRQKYVRIFILVVHYPFIYLPLPQLQGFQFLFAQPGSSVDVHILLLQKS